MTLRREQVERSGSADASPLECRGGLCPPARPEAAIVRRARGSADELTFRAADGSLIDERTGSQGVFNRLRFRLGGLPVA